MECLEVKRGKDDKQMGYGQEVGMQRMLAFDRCGP